MKCPDCEGKLYEQTDEEIGIKFRTCYRCGYYERDGESYKENPELEREIFRKYFPNQVEWEPSPNVGQPFTSPEHWTEPSKLIPKACLLLIISVPDLEQSLILSVRKPSEVLGITETASQYWRLTKPRIWGLLVFTGVVAMLVAYREIHASPSAFGLLLGAVALTFGSASANVLTNYHDRDIDRIMARTRSRPLPSGKIKPLSALVFGTLLAALSILLSLEFNLLAAVFMTIGLVDNIGVYSLLLKRRSWLNIILGGISGGMPVLVGYTAVANAVSPIALYMSALVIVWIPTHIWSLVITFKEDYKAAKVPMLPVVFGDKTAAACIAGTSALLAAFSIAIFLFTSVSLFYTISATILGGTILAYSVKLAIDRRQETAWKLFKLTSPYLTLIFLVVFLDVWFF